MDYSVFGIVLLSAAIQAGWNFFTKRSQSHRIALLAVGWLIFGLGLLPVAACMGAFESRNGNEWRYVVASGAIHAVYICLLGLAYGKGEISVVYPISRGVGVLGTAVVSVALGLSTISGLGWLGVAGVAFGALMIGAAVELRQSMGLAMGVAMTVTGYSVVDSLGAKTVPGLLYMSGIYLLAPIFAGPFLLFKIRSQVASVIRSHKLEAVSVAGAGAVAYGIILWAYQKNNVVYVSALREFSVIIAAGLGVLFLKEPLGKRKRWGILLILTGILFIKFAGE